MTAIDPLGVPGEDIGNFCQRSLFWIEDNPQILRDGSMPTRNISFTPEQDAFIDEVIDAGEYQNASEAVRDAIRALQQRRAEDALKLERLRLAIKAGVDALERGEYTEVSDEDLDAYLDSLVEEVLPDEARCQTLRPDTYVRTTGRYCRSLRP
jgi:antitoxin ParD1/3/4